MVINAVSFVLYLLFPSTSSSHSPIPTLLFLRLLFLSSAEVSDTVLMSGLSDFRAMLYVVCVQFVLKHDRFRHLREVPNCPMTVCSLHPGLSASLSFSLYLSFSLCDCLSVLFTGEMSSDLENKE